MILSLKEGNLKLEADLSEHLNGFDGMEAAGINCEIQKQAVPVPGEVAVRITVSVLWGEVMTP
jgi:hypothetical protein